MSKLSSPEGVITPGDLKNRKPAACDDFVITPPIATMENH